VAANNHLDAWYKKEDYWAIIIAIGLILASTIAFFGGAAKWLPVMAINIPGWSGDFGKITDYLSKNITGIALLFSFFAIIQTLIGIFVIYKVKKAAERDYLLVLEKTHQVRPNLTKGNYWGL
jgi:hypothetical protein